MSGSDMLLYKHCNALAFGTSLAEQHNTTVQTFIYMHLLNVLNLHTGCSLGAILCPFAIVLPLYNAHGTRCTVTYCTHYTP